MPSSVCMCLNSEHLIQSKAIWKPNIYGSSLLTTPLALFEQKVYPHVALWSLTLLHS